MATDIRAPLVPSCGSPPASADGPRTWSRWQNAEAQRLLREGHTYAQVGRAVGKSKPAVMSANHEYWRINWRDWKPEEETTAKEMLRRKCSYAEVAAAVGRSEFAVERKNQSSWRIPYKQRNQVVRTCKRCGQTFRRKRSLVERPGAGQFCRDACYRRYTGETNIERLIREELERRGIAFEQEYEIAGLRLDFFLPRLRAVIECDGIYWHSLPGRPEDDRLKDRFLTWLGFTVHRFTEVEIYGDAAACVAKVLATAARPENAEQEYEARAS